MAQPQQVIYKSDDFGDSHAASSIDTPLREDAFKLDDGTKVDLIEDLFRQIMITLGLDLNDDSLSGTPHRVAKMYVHEIFNGLNPDNKPKATIFENKFKYGEMLVEKNISFYTTCEHHFLPIWGKAHIGYIANNGVIGLSKINRIVEFFAKRPQVQERMTVQILNELKTVLNTEDVAVVIEAKHLCVAARGIEDDTSTTVTSEFSGKFNDDNKKKEFFNYINMDLKIK